MKIGNLSLCRGTYGLLLAVGAWLVLSGSMSSHAFHSNGVGSCGGCHGTHNGRIEPLLLKQTATDVCLSCHAVRTPIVLSVDPLLPSTELGAGDFVFIGEDNINDAADGALNPIPGHRAGHNVVTLSYGITADPTFETAPGGTFPSRDLGCTSCHDPHGSEKFRMLWGAGDTDSSGFRFVYSAPGGLELGVWGDAESPERHSSYQSGWSAWCGNCHGRYHKETGRFGHPIERNLGGNARRSYNEYNGETDPYGGLPETAYVPEVPFEDPNGSSTSAAGPSERGEVTCLSCHRAHATSALAAMRWDTTIVHLEDDGVNSGSYALPNPYPGASQRALCIKCHVDETRDHGLDQACMECHRGPVDRRQLPQERLRFKPVERLPEN
jgi:predicted CXXCH cytochrome family protein